MSEINELLEKLRPLDRNLYDNLKLMQAALGRMDLLCADDVFGDFVQGEVQRACESKSWYWQVAHGECLGYMATVDGDRQCTNYGSSACHALLACYIACLEARP